MSDEPGPIYIEPTEAGLALVRVIAEVRASVDARDSAAADAAS